MQPNQGVALAIVGVSVALFGVAIAILGLSGVGAGDVNSTSVLGAFVAAIGVVISAVAAGAIRS